MKRANGHETRAYGEAQSTAWLVWLARGMQQHGQTVFLIEQLQPSWLRTRWQRWVYILTSRLIWGVVSVLFFLLIEGLIGALSGEQYDVLSYGLDFLFWLIIQLIVGLITGLIVGLIDCVRFGRNHPRSAQHASATPRQIIGGSLLFGLIGGLLGGLSGWLTGRTFGGPIDGLIVGLVFGLVWTHRSFGRVFRNEIQTVEAIRFSWTDAPKSIVNGLIFGLAFGLIFGLTVGLIRWLYGLPVDNPINDLVIELKYMLIGGLIYGSIVGLIVGLVSCFRPGIRELKTVPNQGIRLSLNSGALMGTVGGLSLGFIVGVLGGWTYGLFFGALGGMCIGLWYGGLDVIQHYIVRILLWQAGAMPWNYVGFLDYATEELSFLQKVGGGYMFVHRYLLEYFAAMDLPGQPVAADDHTVPQTASTKVESV